MIIMERVYIFSLICRQTKKITYLAAQRLMLHAPATFHCKNPSGIFFPLEQKKLLQQEKYIQLVCLTCMEYLKQIFLFLQQTHYLMHISSFLHECTFKEKSSWLVQLHLLKAYIQPQCNALWSFCLVMLSVCRFFRAYAS